MNSKYKYRHSLLKSVFSITLLLFVHSCTSSGSENDSDLSNSLSSFVDDSTLITYPADVEPTNEINFVRELTIDNETVEYGLMHRVSVDEKDRILVGSGSGIHVLNPDGSYLAYLGGKGQGPGEFQGMLVKMPKIHGDNVYSYDELAYRMNIFSLETLEPVHSILISPDSWSHIEELSDYRIDPTADFKNYYALNDSTLLIEFRKPVDPYHLSPGSEGAVQYEAEKLYYQMNWNGDFISGPLFKLTDAYTLVQAVNGVTISFDTPDTYTPFFRHTLLKVSENGSIYSALTDQFLITVYNQDGEFQYSFSHAVNGSDLDKEGFIEFMDSQWDLSENMIERIESTEAPDYWPVLNSMFLDDENRLWISTNTDNYEILTWRVLNEDGGLIAKFDWPSYLYGTGVKTGIKAIRNGYMYSMEFADRENHVPELVKYRIELTER